MYCINCVCKKKTVPMVKNGVCQLSNGPYCSITVLSASFSFLSALCPIHLSKKDMVDQIVCLVIHTLGV